MMMDYKTAEKLLEENKEFEKMEAEAKEKEKEVIYKASIHYRVEKLVKLIGKMVEGRLHSDQIIVLETVKIKFSKEWRFDKYRIYIESLSRIEHKFLWRWLWSWSSPEWTRLLVFYGAHVDRTAAVDNTDLEAKYRLRTLTENDKDSWLLDLLEKEIFNHLLALTEKKTPLTFEQSFCQQCGKLANRGDVFCSECGKKLVIIK